jgi:hypothetical protein
MSDKIRRTRNLSTTERAANRWRKTGTLREIQTADAAARNHPADGGLIVIEADFGV